MVRGVAIDKIRSYGLSKEEAEYIVDEIAENHDLDKIYSLRVDPENHTVKLEETKLSPEELYKAAYIHYTSEFFKKHNEMIASDAVKLFMSYKKRLEMQGIREVLNHGESR